ncbi:dipeptidase PepV [Aerococcaceae bacterium zg-BR22]|uniref:dipeptidase PepV n=1 Tax=Aerococcaceae bacterium zg-1292 TaxID=2774330 RepID=UPI0040627F0C|nr:dipeptidase PepV [Aerococcaceae bacterium zg-BR22]
MVNWLAEVEQRKEQLFEDLFRLLRVPSVREDDKATAEAPVGPGPKAALEEFMKMAQEDGFETKQFGPWAGRVEVGSGEQLLGILGHVDVVPVGTGWDTNPFEPVVKDNRIYARGSSDDKGPTVAAYFAIKLLRELGYEFNQRIHLIVGTDEESGWQCMHHYFQHAEMPDFGFSPDAVFPIINGEKGNVSLTLSMASKAQEGAQHLVAFDGGLRENMVIQDVTATVKGLQPSVADLYADFLNEHDLKGHVDINGDEAVFTLVGKAAHGSTPEKGRNAATYLARFLVEFTFDNHAADDFITLLATELHEDFTADKVGVAHHHDVMGDVSMNVGIVSYRAEKGGHIVLNFRFPEGTTPEVMGERFAKTLSHYDFELAVGESKEPHYVPADDPLVATLLEVYENQTGLKGHEMTIGGGTYGRLMPRGVAYGALFPDSIDTMHQANEFLAIDDLLRATAIYAEAIYRLTR